MKTKKLLFLFLPLLFFLNTEVFGQASAYTLTSTLSTFTPVTGGTRLTILEADDNEVDITLPFPFFFEGISYSTISAGSNGHISFVAGANNNTTNNLSSGPVNARPIIAPLWDDLDGRAPAPNASKFEWTVTGTAPNREMTLEWLDWEWRYSASSNSVSFQLKLYETTNVIEFIYDRPSGTVGTNPTASIGLSGISTFLSVQSSGLTPTVSSTNENNAIATRPASGQLYRFTPPSCLPSSNISQTASTATSIDLSWTTGGATDWEIEYGAVGFALGTGTSQLVSTTASTTISGLTASTCYNVYVRDICAPGDSSLWTGPTEMCTAFPAPFIEDFDANATRIMGALANGWSSVSTNTTDPSFPYNWFTANNNVAFASGPDVDHTSGSGNYMYTEAFNTGFGDTAMLFSSYIDFGGLTNPALRYWYHKFGNNMPDLIVQIDSGMGWQGVDTIVGETHLAHATSPADWSQGIKELGGYTGIARLRFIAVSLGCCNGMMGVDDIEIFDLLNDDAKMTSIIQPVDGSCEGSVIVEVEFQNNGIDSIFPGDMTVSYRIGATGNIVTESVNQIIAPFDVATHVFAQNGNVTAGNIDISTWTSLTGDAILSNDTLELQTIAITPVISSNLYCEGFENGNGGWTFGGDNNSWNIGTPTGFYISAAANGTNAAVTNLTGDHNNNEESYLLSPCLDFSAYDTDPVLEFQHIFELESCCDETWVEISMDGGVNWNKLGLSGEGVNWYSNATNHWWNGDSPGGAGVWRKASITMEDAAGESNVKIRFRVSTDGSSVDDGVGLDDVTIYIPITSILDDTLSTCEDPNYTLTANGFYADSLVDYLWSTSPADTFPDLAVTSAGTYTVEVTVDKLGLTFTDSVVVLSQPAPSINFVNDIDTLRINWPVSAIQLDPATPANLTFEWNNQGDISNQPYLLVDPAALGIGLHNVSLTLNDSYGCSSTATHSIRVLQEVGIETLAGSQVNIYPNPTSDRVNLQIEGNSSLGQINVSIVDLQGRTVHNEIIQDQTGSLKTSINVSELSKGLYILRMSTKSGRLDQKLIVQ